MKSFHLLASSIRRSIIQWQKARAFLFLLVCLCLRITALGQVAVMDNFNTGVDAGWAHYAPVQTAPWNEQVSWSFPADPSGGFYYRIFGGVPNINYDPAANNNTGPARVGSFRNDALYTDFLAAVDLVAWNDAIPENTGFLAFHVTAPGFLTTFGYFAGYSRGAWNDQQSSFGFVHFQSELNVSGVSEFNGGGAILSRLNPAGKYRLVATGRGSLYTAAIYSRTDLLEPIVKIAGVPTGSGSDTNEVSGTTGIGAVNYSTDDDKIADFTFDNFYSSINPGDPVGFPGTPQVMGLLPAPQTLFYSIPATNRITFSVQTFNTNQIATNSLKMFLNGTDVSAQLALTDNSIFLMPKTSFGVRYTGGLAANTIYSGQIIAVDTSGKGTTNNFVFDTFSTNGMLVVEAEDYNYGSGQFFDSPPVSGLTTNGTQVNGYGSGNAGYYGLTGTANVDYFNTDAGTGGNYHQYRTLDSVPTAQNLYAGDTPRADHIAANVPDYGLWRLQASDWQNYTRTFPNNNWNVYLRTSSQDREDVRFDEVTGDTTQPNQTKVLRGEFLVPNTGSSTRFRYVPLTDAAGNPQVLGFSGVRTFRMTALGGFDSNRSHGGDDNGSVQPTYFLFLPTAAPASQAPFIAFASPSANATDVSITPTVQIIICNRATSVNCPGSIQLSFDGANVTSAATISCTSTEGPGATVTYTPPSFLMPNSTHSLSLVFNDGSTTQSNQWSFTVANVPAIPASFRLLSAPGTNLSLQVAKAPNTYANPADNHIVDSSWRAERQLANQLIQPSTLAPYTNEAANTPTNYGFYTEPVVINYDTCGNNAGFFAGDAPFPGIDPNTFCPGEADHFAISATINLSLSAGAYRMGVRSDDGFKLTVTTNNVTVWTNAPQTEVQLGIYDANRGNNESTFDFVVATNGVYKFRLLYEQGGGGADCEWYWVNRFTGTRRLINQPPIPASFAGPPGAGADSGFFVQIAQARPDAPESDFPNTSARAEAQLANQIIDGNTGQPYTNLAANLPGNLGLYIEPGTINYEESGNFAGFFGNKPFPGIPPSYAPFVAMAATAYLDLKPGTYSFGVSSDDGFKLDVGPALGTTNQTLGIFEGGRGDAETAFDVVVGTAGLYPVRLLFYQGIGGANVDFYTFDPNTGARILVNDLSNTNSVKAWRTGGWRIVNARLNGANITFDVPTLAGHTITVEYKDSLSAVSWTPLSPTIPGDGTVHTVSFSRPVPARFYHLRVN
ncbi:MAG: hypothetical protein C5B50_27750 [Verrucomicrobia bacterium]|nr:MAG: hypothetical protein C5B50_27750 [Verrucomicrobiota bacterium]